LRDGTRNNRAPARAARIGLRLYGSRASASPASASCTNDRLNCWARLRGRRSQGLPPALQDSPCAAAATTSRRATPPVLPASSSNQLWKNTIGYLRDRTSSASRPTARQARRAADGGARKRQDMAAWIWEACRQRRWSIAWSPPTTTGPPAHDASRTCFPSRGGASCLRPTDGPGLRDRRKIHETEDQAVFSAPWTASPSTRASSSVFHTKLLPRPDRTGRSSGPAGSTCTALPAADAGLRRNSSSAGTRHPGPLDLATAVASTDGYSFAEVEELKNLL